MLPGGVRKILLAALTASLLAMAVTLLASQGSVAARTPQPDSQVTADVGGSPSGQPMGKGFVGVSLEYSALRAYTGNNPRKVNPVLVQLIRNLAPGNQSPVVRIGGDSADSTWWPMRGVIPPGGINYTLTPGWLRTTAAFARLLGARLIMGVNLAADRPALAAAESQALLAGIGKRYIEAFEIGNEPDVYGIFPWYHNSAGKTFYARSSSYDLSDFISQFTTWRTALPDEPVAGPAFAELTWLSGLPQFIAAEPGLKLVTLHRYPLRACISDPSSPIYPSIANLLSDQSSSGLAQQVQPYIAAVHSHGLTFRLDELNSASCSGKRGVSNTFASALWVLDTLFNLAQVGVDGVNIHSLPGAAYQLFTFRHTKAAWEAFVHPEYYGMMMFAQSFPPGAQLLPVKVSPSGPVKVWATRAPDFKTRVVLINKDPAVAYQVQVQVPGFSSQATLERLDASTVSSTSGVTLGGQSFGNETTTGKLAGRLQTETIVPQLGSYTITMPPGSAAVLTQ